MAKSRKAIRPLITLILACLVLSADTKTVIKSTDCITRSLPSDLIPVRDCSEATATRYVKDENERTEIHASATMYQPAFFAGWITTNQGVKYDLDFDAKIYPKKRSAAPQGLSLFRPLRPLQLAILSSAYASATSRPRHPRPLTFTWKPLTWAKGKSSSVKRRTT
jgi:hypothetical protein